MKKARTMRCSHELDHIDAKNPESSSGKRQDAAERNRGTRILSSPAVSARIERLEKEGYITGYQVKLNPALLGYPIKAFINLEVAAGFRKKILSLY